MKTIVVATGNLHKVQEIPDRASARRENPEKEKPGLAPRATLRLRTARTKTQRRDAQIK